MEPTITVTEYMNNVGQALTAYTQLFGSVLKDVLVRNNDVGMETVRTILEDVGTCLQTELEHIDNAMQAKLGELKADTYCSYRPDEEYDWADDYED